jgi:hypothetical protein
MQYVINNKRTACRVQVSPGHGMGGSHGLVELGPGSAKAESLRRWLAEEALPGVLARLGIVGAHLGEADAAATHVRTDEKNLLQTPDAMARRLVLIEGVNMDAVEVACADVLGDAALRVAGTEDEIGRGFYRLSFAMASPA